MRRRYSVYKGCLLGLAAGDAMGYPVENSDLSQIRADFGPQGVMGYDLRNDRADVTSYTQIAAFAANGILLGLTRGKLYGKRASLVRYIGLALREWGRSQHYTDPVPDFCWLSRHPELKRRRCMDTWMLNVLERKELGTPGAPTSQSNHPAALTAVVPLTLVHLGQGVSQEELDQMGAETVAMTHGNPEAFLTGAMLTHLLSRVLEEPELSWETLVPDTCDAIQIQFGRYYPQMAGLLELMHMALLLAKDATAPVDAMERLGCRTAPEVLAGAVYACATSGEDFDTAMITAVNHSGRSSAVGAITGALLGAKLGVEAVPEFYLDSLEPVALLQELACDLVQGRDMEIGSSLFDDDWDRKYLHGGQ